MRSAVAAHRSDVQRYYDAVALDYDHLYADPISAWENARVTDWLFGSDANWSEDSIVDIGCGTGLLLELLSGSGTYPQRYEGIDVSEGMIAEARRKFPRYGFRIGDGTQDVAPCAADVVVAMFGVPSHTKQGLSAMLTALRPRGQFFLMPLAARQTVDAERINRNSHMTIPLPMRMYDAATARKELSHCALCEIAGLNACIDEPEGITDRPELNARIEREAPSCCRYLLVRGVK